MSVFIGYLSFMAYQMMKGKKGNNDGFPPIPGMIARYSALGLTNEEMSKNPVWVDKTGNDHDLQMKNFAWKGMSGVGGYEMNFNLWSNNVPNIPDISMSKTATSVSVSVGNSTYNNNLIYTHISNWNINKNHWLKVTSTYEDGDLIFVFYNDSNTKKIGLPANGYVNILAYPEFKGNYMYISTTSNKQGSFTIEQLPLYPGALVFDGVDDYGVCDNFPILTKERGYTVVALRQWITYNPNAISAIATNASDRSFNGAFTFENYNKGAEQTISYGATQISLQYSKSPFSWQTTSKYNGFNIANGNKDATNSLVLGRSYPQRNEFANAAIWEFVFLDHDATEEELTKIKDYFVKTYPWLFPDQAWTVVGKTNEDEDRATIANITGNGNNLVLSNFGFSGNSGYGLYQQNYAIWTKVSNRATFTVTSSKIHVTSVTAEEHADFIYTTGQQLKQKIRITGLSEGVSFVIGRSGVNLKIISQDGIYDVDILDDSSANPIIGYRINRIIDSCDITIEQIPEYEGYLITDGVDDEIVSAKLIQFADKFTIVGDWKFMEDRHDNAGLVKSNQIYIYNATTGMRIYLKQGSKNYPFSCKKINALTSDGWVYDEKWDKYKVYPIGSDIDISSRLFLGFYSSNFTKIALKNLGIYNDQLLSKDDCIKAYNYLQTLKAK